MIDRIKKLIGQAKGKTPAEKLGQLEKMSESNSLKQKKIDDELSPVTSKIQELKKRYEASSEAQKGLLKPEIQQQLRQFKSLKREREIYLENAAGLTEAIGRMRELAAYQSAGVDEDTFDDLAIDLDEAASSADGVSAAIKDLEKAGRRRRSLSDDDKSFEDELAMFDEVGDSLDDDLAGFEEDVSGGEESEQKQDETDSDSEPEGAGGEAEKE